MPDKYQISRASDFTRIMRQGAESVTTTSISAPKAYFDFLDEVERDYREFLDLHYGSQRGRARAFRMVLDEFKRLRETSAASSEPLPTKTFSSIGLIDVVTDLSNYCIDDLLIDDAPISLAVPDLLTWERQSNHLELLAGRIWHRYPTRIFVPASFNWSPPFDLTYSRDVGYALDSLMAEIPDHQLQYHFEEEGEEPRMDIRAYRTEDIGGYLFDVVTPKIRIVAPPKDGEEIETAFVFDHSGERAFPTYLHTDHYNRNTLDITHRWLPWLPRGSQPLP